MASVQCPYCRSENVVTETRLRSPRTSDVHNSIGQWRIGCGYTLFVVAMLVGAAGLLVRTYWFGAELDPAALWIATLAFLFALVTLGLTVYFSRWQPFLRYTCRECRRIWVAEMPARSVEPAQRTA